MSMARAYLSALSLFERVACAMAFIVMAGALIADVGSRLFTGAGILGAPQVGVIGMIAVAMFGFGIAASKGAQLRPRFLDFVFPKSWDGALDRIADFITGVGLSALGVLCAIMAGEAMRLGDVTSVLRWPIWPMQIIIVVGFATNAIRYFIFALAPALRPRDDIEPETSAIEGAPR
jgi:TRAP-type C4-dicarboxylate transport system permease small subunit